MDSTTKSSLLKTLQKEFIRRSLIQYFESKGYDNFLNKPYPPSMLDMVQNPMFDGVVEIQYFLEDINMQNNTIKVGWNMFVLGNNRAFLGYTTHKDVSEIENCIGESRANPDGPITIKGLVEWMVESIGKSNKIKDLYDRHTQDRQNSVQSVYVKPYTGKTIPDMRRKV